LMQLDTSRMEYRNRFQLCPELFSDYLPILFGRNLPETVRARLLFSEILFLYPFLCILVYLSRLVHAV